MAVVHRRGPGTPAVPVGRVVVPRINFGGVPSMYSRPSGADENTAVSEQEFASAQEDRRQGSELYAQAEQPPGAQWVNPLDRNRFEKTTFATWKPPEARPGPTVTQPWQGSSADQRWRPGQTLSQWTQGVTPKIDTSVGAADMSGRAAYQTGRLQAQEEYQQEQHFRAVVYEIAGGLAYGLALAS